MGVSPGLWKLRHRLLFLIVCVVTGTLVCSLALVEVQVREHVKRRVGQHLQRSTSSFQQRDHERGQALSLMVAALQSDPRLAALMLSQQVEPVVEYLRQSTESDQVVFVTDAQGRLLLRTDRVSRGNWQPGREMASIGPIGQALKGQLGQDYCWLDQGLWRLASSPLALDSKGATGTVTLGYRAEQNLVERVAREFECDAAVFSQDRVITTNERCSLSRDNVARAILEETRRQEVARNPDSGWTEFDADEASTRYRCVLSPLGSKPLAYLAVMQDFKEAAQLVEHTRWLLGGLGVLAVIAATLVSIPVVGRVAQPIELIEAVLQTVGDGLIHVDSQWRIQRLNAAAERLLGCQAQDVLDQDLFRLLTLCGADQEPLAPGGLQSSLIGGQTVRQEDGWLVHRPGSRNFAAAFVIAPVLEDGKPNGAVMSFRDITALKSTQQKLRDLSHQAGMAEVATGTLHNVGNALNSVSVSASLVSEKIRHSRLPNFRKALALLEKEPEDLAHYLTQDPKGRKVISYLGKLTDHLEEHQQGITQELESLLGYVEHVKQVIRMQQAHTKTSGLCELVDLSELFEGALAISQASHPSPASLQIVREFTVPSPVLIEKHKVVQILVNLCSNALEALQTASTEDKVLTLRTRMVGGQVQLEVHDNGPGIDPAHLDKMFTHGFTTKPEGHGFGLHNSALAATAMGGRLAVNSAGLEQGATFVLELLV